MKYSSHHTYLNNEGIEVPSATTVLKLVNKPHLQKWANVMGFKRKKVDDILECSSAIGVEIHAIIEAYVMESDYSYTDSKWYDIRKLSHYMDNFINWYLKEDIAPIFMEESMTSDRYGGTIDFYGTWDDKLTILDWKTSKNFYMTMFVQLGAYCQMLEEKGKVVEQVAIVRVNEDKLIVKKMSREDLQSYIDTFNKLLDFFHIYYDLNESDGWGTVL